MIIGLIVGFAIGFIFSMPPLGPTYFAIIDRGLKNQVKNGVAIGIGAGFMDMVYILVAYGGVTALVSILPESLNEFFLANESTIRLVLAFAGCVVVIFYGIKIMRTKSIVPDPAKNKVKDEKFNKTFATVENVVKKTEKILHTKVVDAHSDVMGSFLIGIVMCLSSVTLPASWFATIGYLKSYRIIDASWLTGVLLGTGVLAGTSLWFYLMTKFISRNSEKIKPSVLNKLNLSTGIFLILLGVSFLVKLSSVYF
ncbi:MAG: LysE family transporter [Ignavibacteria bacterium]